MSLAMFLKEEKGIDYLSPIQYYYYDDYYHYHC